MAGQHTEYAFETAIEHHLTTAAGDEKGDREAFDPVRSLRAGIVGADLKPRHNRRSIRLQGYDYSGAGAYFVTVCTHNRACLFGEIVGAAPCGRPEMVLNDAGRMVQTVWDEIPTNYSGIETDEFAIMPNHIHGIIVIVGAGPRACPGHISPTNSGQPQGVGGMQRCRCRMSSTV